MKEETTILAILAAIVLLSGTKEDPPAIVQEIVETEDIPHE